MILDYKQITDTINKAVYLCSPCKDKIVYETLAAALNVEVADLPDDELVKYAVWLAQNNQSHKASKMVISGPVNIPFYPIKATRGKPKGLADFKDFVADRHELRESLRGVYHADQKRIATDGYVLVSLECSYPDEKEGEIIDPILDEPLLSSTGNPLRYPNYGAVMQYETKDILSRQTVHIPSWIALLKGASAVYAKLDCPRIAHVRFNDDLARGINVPRLISTLNLLWMYGAGDMVTVTVVREMVHLQIDPTAQAIIMFATPGYIDNPTTEEMDLREIPREEVKAPKRPSTTRPAPARKASPAPAKQAIKWKKPLELEVCVERVITEDVLLKFTEQVVADDADIPALVAEIEAELEKPVSGIDATIEADDALDALQQSDYWKEGIEETITEDLSDDAIEKEASRRDLKEKIATKAVNLSAPDFHRHLCDLLEINYHTADATLVQLIADKLETGVWCV